MRRLFDWDEHPILHGTTQAHRCATKAASSADEWLGASKKPKCVVVLRVSRQAILLLESLFFQHIDNLRAKDLEVKIFRAEWGMVPLIQVTAKCGAILRLE